MVVALAGSVVVAIYSLGTVPATAGFVVLFSGLAAFLTSLAKLSFKGH